MYSACIRELIRMELACSSQIEMTKRSSCTGMIISQHQWSLHNNDDRDENQNKDDNNDKDNSEDNFRRTCLLSIMIVLILILLAHG